MRGGNCERHVLRCLIAGIPEHHPLVAGTDLLQLIIGHLVLFDFQRLVDAHRDVRGLLINRSDDSAGVCVKSILASCVTDLTNGITDNLLDIDISLRRDFTHDKHNTCRAGGLAGNTAHRVLFHQCVQNRVRNLVAHLIRMSLSDGLGSKKVLFHLDSLSDRPLDLLNALLFLTLPKAVRT